MQTKTNNVLLKLLLWACQYDIPDVYILMPSWVWNVNVPWSWWPWCWWWWRDMGKGEQVGWREDDSAVSLELNSLSSELRDHPVKISIIPRYQDEINWEIFGKHSVKRNDTANVIFMPSFTSSLLSPGDLSFPGRLPDLKLSRLLSQSYCDGPWRSTYAWLRTAYSSFRATYIPPPRPTSY